jgi:hypothetical protein
MVPRAYHDQPVWPTQHINSRVDHTIELITMYQNLPSPLAAQIKMLILSRSLQRRVTHFTRVVLPDLVQAPLRKLQTVVDDAAFNIPQDGQIATSMGSKSGLDHALVRQKLRLPVPDRGFGLGANSVVAGEPTPEEDGRSVRLHTSSYLAAAAYCHDALTGGPDCLRPFS